MYKYDVFMTIFKNYYYIVIIRYRVSTLCMEVDSCNDQTNGTSILTRVI